LVDVHHVRVPLVMPVVWGAIHAMDVPGLHTLARLVCQRIVTGILHGDKSPMFVYGTVEASSCLQSDAEMLDLVDNILEKRSLSQVGMFLSFPYRKSVLRHLLHERRVFQFLGGLQ
jgi:hypothetical protein